MLARCTSESGEALGEEVLKMCRSLYNTRQMLPAQVSGSPAGACLFSALCCGQCPLLLERDMSSGCRKDEGPLSSRSHEDIQCRKDAGGPSSLLPELRRGLPLTVPGQSPLPVPLDPVCLTQCTFQGVMAVHMVPVLEQAAGAQ